MNRLLIRLFRHSSSAVAAALATWLLIGVGAGAARAQGSAPVLTGTWFVVIHYKDESTKNYDSERWLDRVWAFEQKGSRLQWSDYPIVVLQDTSGRFERTPGNPRSRALDFWEPNEAQLDELMAGPRVNTRGSKSKSMRGSDRKGWKTFSGGPMASSALVVGYREDWSIKGEPGSRVFLIEEILGNAAMDNAEGRTTYSELEISADGKQISGLYDRDGIKKGTFRMIRTPSIRPLVSSDEEESVNERMMRKQADEFMRKTRDAN